MLLQCFIFQIVAHFPIQVAATKIVVGDLLPFELRPVYSPEIVQCLIVESSGRILVSQGRVVGLEQRRVFHLPGESDALVEVVYGRIVHERLVGFEEIPCQLVTADAVAVCAMVFEFDVVDVLLFHLYILVRFGYLSVKAAIKRVKVRLLPH